METAVIDSMLTVPIANVRGVNDLISLLQIENPEYANSVKFAKGKPVDEFLYFFRLDKANRRVILPRNTPRSYFENLKFFNAGALGTEVDFQVNFLFEMRDYQQEYYCQKLLPALQSDTYDLNIQMPCGHGKTLMSLFLAAKRKRNVLVLVTTYELAEQWIGAVKFMFPNNSVSIYNSTKKSYEITDITITTYDLMSDAKYDKVFFSKFGHTIFDEVHRIGAGTYRVIMEKATSTYRTSLSATFRRKDGLQRILQFHCGTAHVMKRQTPGATVFPIVTECNVDLEDCRNVAKRASKFEQLEEFSVVEVKFADGRVEKGHLREVWPKEKEARILHLDSGDKLRVERADKCHKLTTLSSAKIDNAIVEIPKRKELVVELIKDCLKANRKILVLSKRKRFLYELSEIFTKAGVENGVIASVKSESQKAYCASRNMTPEEMREYCITKVPIIFGIDKLAEEGFDVERLDTLLLTHPIKDIEQAVGRVLRIAKGKKPAMVFWLMDEVPNYQNTWNEARGQFKELEHSLIYPMKLDEFREFVK